VAKTAFFRLRTALKTHIWKPPFIKVFAHSDGKVEGREEET